jgi:hypothetical protein
VERRESRRDEEVRDAGQHRQAHGPLDLGLDEGTRRAEAHRRQLHFLGVGDQLLRDGRRLGALPGTVEQRCADALLEAIEPPAHRRDVEAEARGGPGERALAGHGKKEADLLPV